jgi:hypothetical protein
LDLGWASSGPAQFAGFSPAKKKEKEKMLGRDQHNRFRLILTHYFLGLCLT